MIKPIPGYESQYLIDEHGTVYSISRTVATGIGPMTREVGGNIIRPFNNGTRNKMCVKLSKNGKQHTHRIDTLLRRAFGEIPNKW